MAAGEIFSGGPAADRFGKRIEETPVEGDDFGRQHHFAIGRLAQIEVGGAAFLDAYVEHHAGAVAADGFEMGFDDAGQAVEGFFDGGFGAREGVTFVKAERLAEAVLGKFVQAIEIDDADGGRRLRGGEAGQ